jgi:hypothetical protein
MIFGFFGVDFVFLDLEKFIVGGKIIKVQIMKQ